MTIIEHSTKQLFGKNKASEADIFEALQNVCDVMEPKDPSNEAYFDAVSGCEVFLQYWEQVLEKYLMERDPEQHYLIDQFNFCGI